VPSTPPIERKLLTTGYCPCGECCGWERNWRGVPVYSSGPNKGQRKAVGITASGTHARPGTIAADISIYPFGTVMYVDGYGYGRVEDTGGDIKGDRIDLFFKTHREALQWGKQWKRVRIWLP
jgi:3D (Asp-Asp-Asp) domain-containing protein